MAEHEHSISELTRGFWFAVLIARRSNERLADLSIKTADIGTEALVLPLGIAFANAFGEWTPSERPEDIFAAVAQCERPIIVFLRSSHGNYA
jgi:hypothetical protein